MNFHKVKKLTKAYTKIVSILERKKLNKNSRIIFDNFMNIKAAIDDTIKELREDEGIIIYDLYVKKRNRYAVSVERYISEAAIYRLINKFNMNLYIKICRDKKLEKSAIYVINRLQNLI